MAQAIGYIAPSRTIGRVADALLDRYLKTRPGTSDALRLLAASREAARENRWQLPPAANGGRRPETFRRLKDLTAAEMDSICEMYLRADPIKSITERFDVTHGTIVRLLGMRGIERKRRTRIDSIEVHHLFCRGVSVAEIARRLECHESTVRLKLSERLA